MEAAAAPREPFDAQDLISRERAAALAELERLWQELAGACHRSIERLGEALVTRLRELAAAECTQAEQRARRDLACRLQQAARRLRVAGSGEEWAAALLEMARLFCRRAAVLTVRGQTVEVTAAAGFEAEARARLIGLRIGLDRAPAIEAAVEKGELVVAQCLAGELSGELIVAAGCEAGRRAWLVPIQGQGGTAAVLYADGDQAEVVSSGLELAAALAGAPAQSSWPPLAPPVLRAPGQPPRELPEWSQLSREDQDLHLRAQRFARVQVAEMRLYKSEAVEAGRAQRDLYSALKHEIDAAREAFRQFVDASPTMVDYLHRELLRTLAHEDAALLGKDYPGPLV